MSKYAALFSGQGSQYTGMGTELAEKFAAARHVYECAGDILGMDVLKLSSASDDELARTAVAQPVIFTLSAAAYSVACERFEKPVAVAGHSLGEFAALYAAGAYSLEDGFRIIKARAAAMEEAAVSGSPGAMFAVLGSDEDTIAKICENTSGFVVPVNMNLPSQTVISGEVAAAEAAAEALVAGGAKAVRLGVGSAFHTKMMQPAADKFRSELEGICFSPTIIAFYSNLTGDKLEIQDYPEYFSRHMVSPVRFVEQITAMTRDAIELCVEYGPKKTAATLAKKNNRAFKVANVEDEKSLLSLESVLSQK